MYLRGQIAVQVVLILILVAPCEALAADIKGKVSSGRIKDFDGFVVYVKFVSTKLFKVSKNPIPSIQKGMKFIPKVLPVARKSKVIFKNQEESDMHNLHTVIGSPVYFNFGIPPGVEYGPVSFGRVGEVLILCDLHPQIRGYVLVLQNPFFAKVDSDGDFVIKKVPPGEYELETWHPEYVSRSQKISVSESEMLTGIQFNY
ncbi:MAG TPA: hypothetical protein QF720_05695 [Nitrospinota bacterium]|jgi:hypothetical protein|nr:hypothetical protein [Nitrospinota bacterium]|tara:strand:+ start:144 stop:746 length:603 start_codon:yes stop_codon:yes gene_type:complete